MSTALAMTKSRLDSGRSADNYTDVNAWIITPRGIHAGSPAGVVETCFSGPAITRRSYGRACPIAHQLRNTIMDELLPEPSPHDHC
jgi:hypothetical protein